MFDPKKNGNAKAVFIAFTGAMLFAAHPLHTEAVANIKGRDEIVVTLCSVLAVYWVMKSIDSKKWLLYMAAAVFSFLIALFSKESAIPFLVIIPAAVYFFQKEVQIPVIVKRTIPFFLTVFIFWFGVRNNILNLKGDPPAPELMNDPFMKLVPQGNQRTYVPFNSTEKNGMILYTWLEYLRLLKNAIFSHVHNGNGNPATDLTASGNVQAIAALKSKAEDLENRMLSKNIRIN
jgi:hypothetical protein